MDAKERGMKSALQKRVLNAIRVSVPLAMTSQITNFIASFSVSASVAIRLSQVIKSLPAIRSTTILRPLVFASIHHVQMQMGLRGATSSDVAMSVMKIAASETVYHVGHAPGFSCVKNIVMIMCLVASGLVVPAGGKDAWSSVALIVMSAIEKDA